MCHITFVKQVNTTSHPVGRSVKPNPNLADAFKLNACIPCKTGDGTRIHARHGTKSCATVEKIIKDNLRIHGKYSRYVIPIPVPTGRSSDLNEKVPNSQKEAYLELPVFKNHPRKDLCDDCYDYGGQCEVLDNLETVRNLDSASPAALAELDLFMKDRGIEAVEWATATEVESSEPKTRRKGKRLPKPTHKANSRRIAIVNEMKSRCDVCVLLGTHECLYHGTEVVRDNLLEDWVTQIPELSRRAISRELDPHDILAIIPLELIVDPSPAKEGDKCYVPPSSKTDMPMFKEQDYMGWYASGPRLSEHKTDIIEQKRTVRHRSMFDPRSKVNEKEVTLLKKRTKGKLWLGEFSEKRRGLTTNERFAKSLKLTPESRQANMRRKCFSRLRILDQDLFSLKSLELALSLPYEEVRSLLMQRYSEMDGPVYYSPCFNQKSLVTHRNQSRISMDLLEWGPIEQLDMSSARVGNTENEIWYMFEGRMISFKIPVRKEKEKPNKKEKLGYFEMLDYALEGYARSKKDPEINELRENFARKRLKHYNITESVFQDPTMGAVLRAYPGASVIRHGYNCNCTYFRPGQVTCSQYDPIVPLRSVLLPESTPEPYSPMNEASRKYRENALYW